MAMVVGIRSMRWLEIRGMMIMRLDVGIWSVRRF